MQLSVMGLCLWPYLRPHAQAIVAVAAAVDHVGVGALPVFCVCVFSVYVCTCTGETRELPLYKVQCGLGLGHVAKGLYGC